ncbi:MAG: sugar ABC transporter substrate-binding protein [Chloroflexi bacterium]|jgi:multiple sugar transport system substrate-binding protein|uniref:ABC transporter substrate-binding protein n=1 Tax=Candidatus Thermofonsia Clade 3 bacterium TaxID=2364212 RepID=A0A2M8QF76_9CHLR|nr:sugar ABC transporter substrate-binding protein [Candidatus Roseilinea sp. NK_OTU-006]PJF48465.1 MAG: ABC transporter substrate-binding protein [Candidatus Thermofonsia Clade 3 bacterium]RMG66173.1 MAG: sugar ABC transporter substrate-binding protein [Chloroflexota bacterium]
MNKRVSILIRMAGAMSVLLSACAAPVAPTAPAAPQAPAATEASAPAATQAPAAPQAPAATPKGGLRKSNSGYKGTLNLWVLGYTPGNQFANPFDLAIAQFEADNPDINVEITGYPPNDEGFTKLTTALQSGQGIDVLRLPSDRLPAFVKDDLIAPIDDYLTDADKADILPNTLDAVRLKDGKAYAWPLWVVPMGIYLNLDVFQEAGVPLPPKDWTWDQFVETAKKLTFQRANGEQVYGFSGFIDPGVINTWGLWMNEDPSVRPIVDGKFGFDSDKAAAGLKRFAELALVHKVTPPDFGSQKDADVKGGFKNKQYGMIVDATGFSPQLKADKINFAIYPLPSVNGNRLTVGAIGVIAVAATSDKVKEQAAMDLARYLTSAEVQEDVPPSETAATGFYLAPAARRSVKVAPPLDQFVPMLDYMWITPLTPAWPKLTRLFHPEYQNIVFGKADPREAMAKIAPEANALIAEQ